MHSKLCPPQLASFVHAVCDIEGQEYSKCKGCDGTCADPNPPCLDICEPGCSCVNGTVVHKGECISPDECPEVPGECMLLGVSHGLLFDVTINTYSIGGFLTSPVL